MLLLLLLCTHARKRESKKKFYFILKNKVPPPPPITTTTIIIITITKMTRATLDMSDSNFFSQRIKGVRGFADDLPFWLEVNDSSDYHSLLDKIMEKYNMMKIRVSKELSTYKKYRLRMKRCTKKVLLYSGIEKYYLFKEMNRRINAFNVLIRKILHSLQIILAQIVIVISAISKISNEEEFKQKINSINKENFVFLVLYSDQYIQFIRYKEE